MRRYIIPKGTEMWLLTRPLTHPGEFMPRYRHDEFRSTHDVEYTDNDLVQSETTTYYRFKLPENSRGVLYIDVFAMHVRVEEVGYRINI